MKATAAKFATYHTDAAPLARRLEVLDTNKNGTVELGRIENGEKVLVIGSCPVSAEAKVGHCVLDLPAKKASGAPEAPASEPAAT